MRIFNKIVESKTEPSNKNDIWLDGEVFKIYKAGEWQAFTIELDAANTVKNIIDNASNVYQEKLIAGDGVVLENNTISTEALYKIVNVLPSKGKHNTIYLVYSTDQEDDNHLIEYIWVNNGWEKLGEFKNLLDINDYLEPYINRIETLESIIDELTINVD